MYSTNYDSPHGLMNKWNYSTAHDIAKLAYKCMQDSEFREVVKTKTYECYGVMADGNKRRYQWDNTNKLLGVEGFNGVKTGVTDAAGPCLTASY